MFLWGDRKLARKKSKNNSKINEDFIEVGGMLRAFRLENDLTLEEASKRMGISIIHLSEIERAIKIPSITVISAIARAYNINEVELAAQYKKLPKSLEDFLFNHIEITKIIYDIANNKELSKMDIETIKNNYDELIFRNKSKL